MNNDNLERFFQNGLNEQSDLDSNWDMPSDAVWGGIEAALPEDNRNKIIPLVPAISLGSVRKLKWGAAASVLMLVFAYTAYLSQQKIGNLQQQMALQSNQLQQLQSNKGSNNISQSGNTSTFQFSKKETSISDKVNSFLAQVGEEIFSTTNHSNAVFTDREKEFIALEKMALFSSSVLSDEDFTLSSNDLLIPSSIQPVDIHKKNIHLGAFQQELDSKRFLIEPVETQKSKTPHFYAGVFAGPSKWKTTTKSKVSDAVLLKGRTTSESTIETGVKVGWKINDNWSLESGVSIARNTRTEEHQTNYQINPTNEARTIDGTMQSTHDAKINTSFGHAEVALDVSRDGEGYLDASQSFETNYNSELTTSLVQVPLTARYGIQKGKVNVSLSAGVQMSFLKDQKMEFSQKEALQNTALLEEKVLLASGPEMKNVQYGVQAGLQVAYRPTSTVEFYIAPSYTKGLTPIAEDEETSTSLAQMGLMAGVNMYF
ncbi:MAG: hypothetical protein AB8F74_07225 [Saprospiraceae bacterium]